VLEISIVWCASDIRSVSETGSISTIRRNGGRNPTHLLPLESASLHPANVVHVKCVVNNKSRLKNSRITFLPPVEWIQGAISEMIAPQNDIFSRGSTCLINIVVSLK
jgi:hypothetical protein